MHCFVIQKYASVQLSWEATPGEDTGFLPDLLSAPYEVKKNYLEEVYKALEDETLKSHNDIISNKIGLDIKNILFGYSAWQGLIGAGAQSFTTCNLAKPKGLVEISPPDKEILDKYSALLGYILNQTAIVYHAEDKHSAEHQRNGFQAIYNRALNEKEFKSLYLTIYYCFGTYCFGSWELAPAYTSNGFKVLNFVEGLSAEDFSEGMKMVMNILNSKGVFGGGLKKSFTFHSIGNYIGNDWRKYPKGEDYQKIVNNEEIWSWATGIRNRIISIQIETGNQEIGSGQ